MADPQATPPTAGALLRAAREKQGLHIAALAAAIKVAPRKLDALENDRWQELPDATFTRALAQTVCRTLKIDSRPVLALLPAAITLPLEPIGNGMNQPFRDRSGRDAPAFGASAIRPMVWAAAVLMVAAVAIYFAPPDLWQTRPTATAQAPAPAAVPVPAVAASGAGLQATLAETHTASSAAPAASAAAAQAAASSGAVAAPAVALTAGETVFSTPPSAAASASSATGLIQLSSSDPSWVDARDARGTVLLSRTVLPGESVGLNGNLPIRLTIGNAAVTQLQFRGQPVDLAPRTRENVARVELQ